MITQGAHNQYGDLPWVARMEGLMQQWMLGRAEMRDSCPAGPWSPTRNAGWTGWRP